MKRTDPRWDTKLGRPKEINGTCDSAHAARLRAIGKISSDAVEKAHQDWGHPDKDKKKSTD